MSWECPFIFLLSRRAAAKGGDPETGSQAFEGPVGVCVRAQACMYVRVHVLVAFVYDVSACKCVCRCVQAPTGSELHLSARPSLQLPGHRGQGSVSSSAPCPGTGSRLHLPGQEAFVGTPSTHPPRPLCTAHSVPTLGLSPSPDERGEHAVCWVPAPSTG